MAEKLRYRVVKKCFVNDQLIDPATAPGPVYVMLEPGSAGVAFVLAPEAAASQAAPDRTVRTVEQQAARIAELEREMEAGRRMVLDANEEIKKLWRDLEASERELIAKNDALGAEKAARAADAAALEGLVAELDAAKKAAAEQKPDKPKAR